MKKISDNKIKFLIALMLLMLIALSGCASSKEEAAAKSDSESKETSVSFTTSTTGESARDASAPSYAGSDLVLHEASIGSGSSSEGSYGLGKKEFAASDVITDSFGEIFVEAEKDALMDISDSFPEIFAEEDLSTDFVEDEGVIITDPIEDYPEVIEDPKPEILPRAGLLTAGEWNDNKNFSFLQELLASEDGRTYAHFLNEWGLTPFTQYPVKVTDSQGNPVENASVVLTEGAQGNIIYQAKTDNNGMAYLFSDLNQKAYTASLIKVSKDGITAEAAAESADGSVIPVILDGTQKQDKALDFMLVVDTTGSMGDEITYLQEELLDVLNRIRRENANIDVNVSVNFYRDHGDDYIVRSNPFTKDFDSAISLLKAEEAFGGGDFEEAVEEALADAVFNHNWTENNTKICFIVLDAPPHHGSTTNASLMSTVEEASKMGIRIIPIAASGIDKDTEFLLRALAITTGGTYTFLTDDSGIGGGHITPTVGDYQVEHLNDLMVRIVGEYLK